VGEQAVVALSQIRAVRRVVKQLPAVIKCVQMYGDVHCHSGTLDQHSMLCVANGSMHIILVFCNTFLAFFDYRAYFLQTDGMTDTELSSLFSFPLRNITKN
jgi:hypothetical protein